MTVESLTFAGTAGVRGDNFTYTTATTVLDTRPHFYISGVAGDPKITFVTGLWATTSGGFYNANVSIHQFADGVAPTYTVYYAYQ